MKKLLLLSLFIGLLFTVYSQPTTITTVDHQFFTVQQCTDITPTVISLFNTNYSTRTQVPQKQQMYFYSTPTVLIYNNLSNPWDKRNNSVIIQYKVIQNNILPVQRSPFRLLQ